MTKVACVGLGAIGLAVTRTVLEQPELQLVAAVDSAPGAGGRALEDLLGAGSRTGLHVEADLASVVAEHSPDVVLLSTTSRLEFIAPQVLVALEGGASVVSTCEELSCPWGEPAADEITAAAVRSGRAVLGTGVNPGYVMDLVAALLTLPCRDIKSVVVERTVDLRRRREALRAKAGVGMTQEEFQRRAASATIGHVGLDRSARLLARAVGADDARLPRVELVPLVDAGGIVYGFQQATGYPKRGEAPAVQLRLEMSMRVDRESDRFSIEAQPPVSAEIEGGVFGDSATAALVVNAVPLVLAAAPGLHTVLDVPVLRGWKPSPC